MFPNKDKAFKITSELTSRMIKNRLFSRNVLAKFERTDFKQEVCSVSGYGAANVSFE